MPNFKISDLDAAAPLDPADLIELEQPGEDAGARSRKATLGDLAELLGPGPAGGPSPILPPTSGALTIDSSHRNATLQHSTGTIELPDPASIGFEDGDFVNVRRSSSGVVDFVAGAGASLDYNSTLYAPSIFSEKDMVAAIACGTTWWLVGPLEEA